MYILIMKEEDKKNTIFSGKSIYNIIFYIITIYAMYLSYTCNKGFDFVEFITACCCGPCYVVYKLFVGCNKVKILNKI